MEHLNAAVCATRAMRSIRMDARVVHCGNEKSEMIAAYQGGGGGGTGISISISISISQDTLCPSTAHGAIT
jgi:hypothetical protein